MPDRPFRFALTVDGRERATLIEMVRKAEDFGFDVIAGVDHIAPPVGVIPLLASVAQMTSLRLSPMVVANDYRHPVTLAKDCATIDVLSEGRFELGIGTGWIKDQYDSIGLDYDRGGRRVDRLVEAVAVIKGCWTGEPFRFVGEHYQVDLVGSPVPVQRPRPPVLIAGAGRRMLRLAGAEADIVGITLTYGHKGFDTFDLAIARSGDNLADQLSWVREGAGDRFADLELNVMIHRYLESETQAVAFAAESNATSDDIHASPHILVGTTAQMVETLQQRRESLGLSYVVVRGVELDAIGPAVSELAGS